MWAELSAARSLADERPRHEIASPNLFDAARARIQATCDLLADPLDAILADIEREDIEEGARAAQQNQAAARTIFLWLRRHLLLVWINHRTLQRQQRDAALAHLRYEQDYCRHVAVAQERRRHEEAAKCAAVSAQQVRQRARPRRCTGRRNCPHAPSPPDEAPPSHPHQMLGGLHTPASTTLAQATSLCRSVVSSTTPSSMAPPTPSLPPFTFLGDVVRSSSGGGDTYPFRAACDASHHLVLYAGVMVLVLPIKWSLFFAGDIIGLTLPTNLLVMDGIKQGGRGDLFLVLRDSPFSSSLVLRKLFFLGCSLLIFVFPFFFYLFWLIMVHHPSFASFALFPVRPIKISNAVMAGSRYRQNHKTP